MYQPTTLSNPYYIGWRAPNCEPHICRFDDFLENIIGAAMMDIYPEKIWDSLLQIKGDLGETNYVQYKEFVRNTGIITINQQTEGHPFLIQEESPHKKILSQEYQNQLGQIKVIYIYEDLNKNQMSEQKYINQLNSAKVPS